MKGSQSLRRNHYEAAGAANLDVRLSLLTSASRQRSSTFDKDRGLMAKAFKALLERCLSVLSDHRGSDAEPPIKRLHG